MYRSLPGIPLGGQSLSRGLAVASFGFTVCSLTLELVVQVLGVGLCRLSASPSNSVWVGLPVRGICAEYVLYISIIQLHCGFRLSHMCEVWG